MPGCVNALRNDSRELVPALLVRAEGVADLGRAQPGGGVLGARQVLGRRCRGLDQQDPAQVAHRAHRLHVERDLDRGVPVGLGQRRGVAVLVHLAERRGRLGGQPVVVVERLEVRQHVRVVVPVDDRHGLVRAAGLRVVAVRAGEGAGRQPAGRSPRPGRRRRRGGELRARRRCRGRAPDHREAGPLAGRRDRAHPVVHDVATRRLRAGRRRRQRGRHGDEGQRGGQRGEDATGQRDLRTRLRHGTGRGCGTASRPSTAASRRRTR